MVVAGPWERWKGSYQSREPVERSGPSQEIQWWPLRALVLWTPSSDLGASLVPDHTPGTRVLAPHRHPRAGNFTVG